MCLRNEREREWLSNARRERFEFFTWDVIHKPHAAVFFFFFFTARGDRMTCCVEASLLCAISLCYIHIGKWWHESVYSECGVEKVAKISGGARLE